MNPHHKLTEKQGAIYAAATKINLPMKHAKVEIMVAGRDIDAIDDFFHHFYPGVKLNKTQIAPIKITLKKP
jgi:hypothetical protein